jgi:hypothetical protein
MLVDELDKDKEKSKVSNFESLLLAAICQYINGYFYNLIESGREEYITELVQDENGEEEIYCIPYTRELRRLSHQKP